MVGHEYHPSGSRGEGRGRASLGKAKSRSSGWSKIVMLDRGVYPVIDLANSWRMLSLMI